jgi:hypothetical protein
LFIYLFIYWCTHTHTQTRIVQFSSCYFQRRQRFKLILGPEFRGTGICFITDFVWWDQWASGNWVVWGNAEEKVQIVNALAKVRYGGGGGGGQR